jgi:hypothetical protein
VQLDPKPPLPVEESAKLPAGAVAVPGAVSWTVTVQFVTVAIGSDPGEHATAVLVARFETVSPVLPPLAPSIALPPYAAEIVGDPVALGV